MDEHERARLKSFLAQLEEQDILVREGLEQNVVAVSRAQVNVISHIFEEMRSYQYGFVTPFEEQDDARGLRSQIRDARLKVVARLKELGDDLGVGIQLQKATETALSLNSQVDKRRVFVVFGRNIIARDAIFDFLRAIDLNPIEWEEAIAMTGSTSAHVLTAIDRAFSHAQAAVIVLTGDDMARLGRTYQQDNDEPYEKQLTPQARPNVLFEAGMAFGKYPERTIIVSFSKTRPFTDIGGVHIIYLSDDEGESRTRLADRLKSAKCDVRNDHKKDWLKAGDFTSAKHDPDVPPGPDPFRLKVLRRQAEYNETAEYQRKVRIQIRNDGHECLKIHNHKWKRGVHGISAKVLPATLQLKMAGKWFPTEHGAEHVFLGPGETMQTWIAPAKEYSPQDLENRCEGEGAIGALVLLINGAEVDVWV